MDNWPFFEERFAPVLRSEAPVYQDGLIVSLLFLLLISAAFFILRQRSKKDIFGIAFLIFSALQSIFLLSVTLALLMDTEALLFWEETFRFTYTTTALLATRLFIYLWIWIAFSRGKNKALWFREYLRIWSYFGYALFIPILLLMLGWGGHWLPIVLIGIVYLAYRVVILILSLNIFAHLRGYPLHIILYLCTCEIAPLLFVFLGV